MKIYHYHKKTGELLGESDARLDPLETKKQGKNVYSLPAQATFEAPPETGNKEAAKRLPDNSRWEVVPDFRGEKYWLVDGTGIEITRLNETVPNDTLSEPPAPPPPTKEEINEQKIADEIRKLAIDNLIAKGELPADFQAA